MLGLNLNNHENLNNVHLTLELVFTHSYMVSGEQDQSSIISSIEAIIAFAMAWTLEHNMTPSTRPQESKFPVRKWHNSTKTQSVVRCKVAFSDSITVHDKGNPIFSILFFFNYFIVQATTDKSTKRAIKFTT